MFESLTGSLSSFFRKVGGKGKKLTEADIREGLRTVRMSLLEADVALPVVKDFIEKVTVKAIGADVIGAVDPSQQIVKVLPEGTHRFDGACRIPIISGLMVPLHRLSF